MLAFLEKASPFAYSFVWRPCRACGPPQSDRWMLTQRVGICKTPKRRFSGGKEKSPYRFALSLEKNRLNRNFETNVAEMHFFMVQSPQMDEKKYEIFHGNVLEAYQNWPSPDLIISDGAYGVRGFRGDTVDVSSLGEWYLPHLLEWSKKAKPSTSLWFWNTEEGWATMHPLLVSHGWDFVQLAIWDKGLAHVAGNVNGKTIRQLPVVTEVSALYRRRLLLNTEDGRALGAKEWLRYEWERSGIPLCKANEACGVKSAATRKYLTKDWLWYWPPGECVQAMAEYCRTNGPASDRPYFSLDGRSPVTAAEWDGLRAVWNHRNGITNVWSRPPLADSERFKGTMERSAPRMHRPTRFSCAHLNQKPLDLMSIQVNAASNEGDVVWEPFGGLASASVSSILLGRIPYTAEVDDLFASIAEDRLRDAAKGDDRNGE